MEILWGCLLERVHLRRALKMARTSRARIRVERYLRRQEKQGHSDVTQGVAKLQGPFKGKKEGQMARTPEQLQYYIERWVFSSAFKEEIGKEN